MSPLRHFEEEMTTLAKKLLEMASLVESGIYHSVLALSERDPQVGKQVLQNEPKIDQLEIEIDALATRLLALEQPVAKDLRFITAAMKINSDLERMADMAVNIVERANELRQHPDPRPAVAIPQMAASVETMMRKALDAFVKRDADLAQQVLEADNSVDQLRDAIYTELVQFMQENPASVSQGLSLIFVARNLERIADHSTNIAEDVLYMVKGIDVRHHAKVPD